MGDPEDYQDPGQEVIPAGPEFVKGIGECAHASRVVDWTATARHPFSMRSVPHS